MHRVCTPLSKKHAERETADIIEPVRTKLCNLEIIHKIFQAKICNHIHYGNKQIWKGRRQKDAVIVCSL